MKVKVTPDVTMPSFEMARWGALIEAINIVGEECDDRSVDFETVNLEPLVLRKYVESTCDRICQKIEQERKKEKEISKKRTAITTDKIVESIYEGIFELNEKVESI